MRISQHSRAVNEGATSVRLPPINTLTVSEPIAAFSNGLGANGYSNGTSNVAGSVGTSGMVSQTARGSTSQRNIYRSIPPKPQNFTLSDMLGSGIIPPPNGAGVKRIGMAGNTPSEFAKRFMTRPTTQPKVIEFNVGKINYQKKRRGISGFFPPVKLRGSAKGQPPPPPEPPVVDPSSRLQLIPTSYSEVRPKSEARSVSRSSRNSRHSVPTRKSPDSVRTAPPAPLESIMVYPETFECDDLSSLPPPKRILPKRDTPWVFRYKVKRNMNELSKIMASKPPLVDV